MTHHTWFVYILRCVDNSLYTGITTDINKRVEQHNGLNNGASNRGAKYTQSRRPVTLVYQEAARSRSAASKREYMIKQLAKSLKEQLIERQQYKKQEECNYIDVNQVKKDRYG